MPFSPPPPTACWQHQQARNGFEAAYFQAAGSGWVIDGTTAAVEDGQSWVVTYRVEVDHGWVTRRAHIHARTAAGQKDTGLEHDGAGHWRVDGTPDASLDGCLDVDLESSAMTNTLPVHRLHLPANSPDQAVPAVYVRARDLTVGRLEQTYRRIADQAGGQRYRYAAPAFDFTSDLAYDEHGLVTDYPGLAVRAR